MEEILTVNKKKKHACWKVQSYEPPHRAKNNPAGPFLTKRKHATGVYSETNKSCSDHTKFLPELRLLL